ncbi:hypothetical protein M5K25_022659 [Dendrobium thyrsiflorum]|uniref:Uncharacterized protein n=1 Tax=Dendrobium thyrsiflorum TaxID=117978 RepID=A0ABD0UCT1_DENTH
MAGRKVEVLEGEIGQLKTDFEEKISDFQNKFTSIHEKMDGRFAALKEMMKKMLEGKQKTATSETTDDHGRGGNPNPFGGRENPEVEVLEGDDGMPPLEPLSREEMIMGYDRRGVDFVGRREEIHCRGTDFEGRREEYDEGFGTFLCGKSSHKDVKDKSSWLLRAYYQHRYFMAFCCVGSEVLYIILFLIHESQDESLIFVCVNATKHSLPLLVLFTLALFGWGIKQIVNIIQSPRSSVANFAIVLRFLSMLGKLVSRKLQGGKRKITEIEEGVDWEILDSIEEEGERAVHHNDDSNEDPLSDDSADDL